MSTAFAAAETRLGASLLARMSNVSISIADGPSIDGMLRSVGRESYVGMGMSGREIEFEGPIADLADAAEGMAVAVTYRGTATQYLVAERLPDNVHLQTATLILRRSA